MDSAEMRSRAEAARVARLATAGADGRPHVVPICFVLEGQILYFAVDAKPKRTTNLKRLRNIASNPAVAVLIDHYEDDWDRLWWVRLDGPARVVTDAVEVERAIQLLAERYAQYRTTRPAGPVIAVAIEAMTGWSDVHSVEQAQPELILRGQDERSRFQAHSPQRGPGS